MNTMNLVKSQTIKIIYDISIISHPVKFNLDLSSLLCYSFYFCHSVQVTNCCTLKEFGWSYDGQISSSHSTSPINHYTEFSNNKENCHQLTPISAFCFRNSTLYLFSQGCKGQLIFWDIEINNWKPAFLDIGNHH